MNVVALTRQPRAGRRALGLTSDARALGLRRQVIMTSSGRVVVRASAATGSVATILLHGAAGSWTTWTPLLRAAQRSGDPLTDVIAIDVPGWGESRALTSGFDIAHLSRTVCEVARSLGYEHWTIVGHSLGGFLALDIAARAGAHTRAVLLISPTGPAALEAVRHPIRGGIPLPGFAGMLIIMRVLAAMGTVGAGFVRWLNGVGLLRVFSAPLFAHPAHVHRTVIDALPDDLRPGAVLEAARAAAEYDESLWQAIACPVRSIRGERDVFVHNSDRARFARLIPDFDEATVRSAGHFAAVEQPDAVRHALRSAQPTGTSPSSSLENSSVFSGPYR